MLNAVDRFAFCSDGAVTRSTGPQKTKKKQTSKAAAKTKSKAKQVKKTRREKEWVPLLETAEVQKKDIRRTIEGRIAVQRVVESLCRLDEEVFPSAPCFAAGPEGQCRLNFEGASTFTRQTVLDASGRAVQSLCLVRRTLPVVRGSWTWHFVAHGHSQFAGR